MNHTLTVWTCAPVTKSPSRYGMYAVKTSSTSWAYSAAKLRVPT